MQELTLEERKKLSLEILIEIDKRCKLNNIPYFLGYGSLIGAIRHKGFIPWDDDIDIWVPMEYYHKFLTDMKKNSKYEALYWRDKDNKWNESFAKISDSRTIIKRADGADSQYRGVAIDVFPLMNIGDAKWIEDIRKANRNLRRLITYRYNTFPRSKSRYLIMGACRLLLLQHKDEDYWNDRIVKMGEAIKTSKYRGCPFSIYGSKDIFNAEYFKEAVDVEFEGHKFSAPVAYHEVLTNLYGDYMQPPPEDKRVSNHNVKAYWK